MITDLSLVEVVFLRISPPSAQLIMRPSVWLARRVVAAPLGLGVRSRPEAAAVVPIHLKARHLVRGPQMM